MQLPKPPGRVTGMAKKLRIPRKAPAVRNRVVEARTVKPTEVQSHPLNWRTHGQNQRGAMRGLYAEVGFVKPVDVYIPAPTDSFVVQGVEVNGTLRKLRAGVPCIMDGHLRTEELPPDFDLTINVTDLTEGEAITYLVTCDPLAGLAGQDDEMLMHGLSLMNSDNAQVQQMLADLVDVDDGGEDENDGDGSGDGQFQIVVDCRDEDHQRELVQQFTEQGLTYRALVA